MTLIQHQTINSSTVQLQPTNIRDRCSYLILKTRKEDFDLAIWMCYFVTFVAIKDLGNAINVKNEKNSSATTDVRRDQTVTRNNIFKDNSKNVLKLFAAGSMFCLSFFVFGLFVILCIKITKLDKTSPKNDRTNNSKIV